MCCILEFTVKTDLNYEEFIILVGFSKVCGMGLSIICIPGSRGLVAVTLLLIVLGLSLGFCRPPTPREQTAHIGAVVGTCAVHPMGGKITLSV